MECSGRFPHENLWIVIVRSLDEERSNRSTCSRLREESYPGRNVRKRQKNEKRQSFRKNIWHRREDFEKPQKRQDKG